MFSNNRRNKEETQLELNTKTLKNELMYLKKCRKQNNNEIFYNKSFIDTLKEKPNISEPSVLIEKDELIP